jgi:flagellar biosynthesis/type III secretory pathway M-ring protein FliF/YscJ
VKARINRSDAETIRQALDQLSAKGSVRKEGDEFLVEAERKEPELRLTLATFILRA